MACCEEDIRRGLKAQASYQSLIYTHQSLHIHLVKSR